MSATAETATITIPLVTDTHDDNNTTTTTPDANGNTNNNNNKQRRNRNQNNQKDGDDVAAASSSSSSSSSTSKSPKPRACFAFAQSGSCPASTTTEGCPFSHDKDVIAGHLEQLKKRLCTEYKVSGHCKLGDTCLYSHSIIKPSPRLCPSIPTCPVPDLVAPTPVRNDNNNNKKNNKKNKKSAVIPSELPHEFSTPLSPSPSPPPSTLLQNPTISGNTKGGGKGLPDLTHILVRHNISAKLPRAQSSFHSLKDKPFIIGVTGGTASGKTTVCMEMSERLDERVNIAMLQMDRFYKSLPHNKPAEKHNFDVPEAFDWDLFVETLAKLSTGATVQVPRYSFETHQRLAQYDTFSGADVIVVEGILVLHDQRIRDQFDLKVFVEADSDVRLARRIQRDIRERGRTIDSVIDQYIKTVKPAHEMFIQPSARYADIIVPHNGPKNGIAIDLLAQHISTEIYKRGVSLQKAKSQKNKKNKKQTNTTTETVDNTQTATAKDDNANNSKKNNKKKKLNSRQRKQRQEKDDANQSAAAESTQSSVVDVAVAVASTTAVVIENNQ